MFGSKNSKDTGKGNTSQKPTPGREQVDVMATMGHRAKVVTKVNARNARKNSS